MRVFISALLAGAFLGCRKDSIEARRVPKEAPAAAASSEAARPGGLRWTAPAGWKELPGDGMRVATFALPPGAGKAEASVVALPGDVGGELANVNRWRGQLSLPPLSEDEMAGARKTVASAAGGARMYDFVGGGVPKTRLIAAMIRQGDTTWFFKLMGEEKAVAAARPAFVGLVKGLKSDAP